MLAMSYLFVAGCDLFWRATGHSTYKSLNLNYGKKKLFSPGYLKLSCYMFGKSINSKVMIVRILLQVSLLHRVLYILHNSGNSLIFFPISLYRFLFTPTISIADFVFLFVACFKLFFIFNEFWSCLCRSWHLW